MSMHTPKHIYTYTDACIHYLLSLTIGEVWIDYCDPGWEEIIDTPDHRTRG